MLRSFFHYLCGAGLTTLSLLACTARAEDMPAALKAWKYAEYTQRYYLKVEAPGEAGNVGMHSESAMLASVTLPLKIIGEGATARAERLALIGEDGVLQTISARPVTGSTETEIVFQTYQGQRRFCLYAGAAKPPAEVSPLTLRPVPILVRVRGVSAGPEFLSIAGNPPKPTPLTLQRFLNMENQTSGSPLPPIKTQANPEFQPNIDDAECPFSGIAFDIFDRISHVTNPSQYAALYEGFLRCPVAGKYKFAIDTPGAVHLVIDGKAVLEAPLPDENREPFALNQTIELSEGVHRVVVHYAEAGADGRTNADARRFGLRLHWQPPFSSGLMCIPPQAFVKYLPAIVAEFESAPGAVTPFVHVETLGHVRVAAQKGDNAAREYLLACVRTTAAPGTGRLRASAAGMADAVGEAGQRSLCAWVPAGTPVAFGIDGVPASKRAVTWPSLKTGLKEFLEREVMDLEAELLVKSAPEFLYPNEAGHIHLETVLSPKPVIIHKTRFDTKDANILGWELLPPPAHPMGEFTVYFEQDGKQLDAFAATPTPKRGASEPTGIVIGDDGGRKKLRASFPAALQSVSASSQLTLRLVVDGVECQQERFRMLYAHAPSWPGRLMLEAGELAFMPSGAAAAQERVVMLVPQEDESAHRRMKFLDVLTSSFSTTEALFVGDPLVEGTIKPQAGQLIGLSARLAKSRPDLKWTAIDVAGPHRYRPLLRMLAELDQLTAAAGGKKLPKLAIVNLGSGDVARQTPLHIFERAMDTLLARLNAGGVEKVIVVGVIPEPWREKQCEPYQERVNNVVRQHHTGGIDLFRQWTQDSDWARRFTPTGQSGNVAGPLPNAATIDEIVKLILMRM